MFWTVNSMLAEKMYVLYSSEFPVFSKISNTSCIFNRYLLNEKIRTRPRCILLIIFSLVQFSRSVMSDSLKPHESQHARSPCPSPTPGVHSNSCPSSRRCHPAISSSVIPFYSCPQSLPASEPFPISQLFAWGSQSIGVSALASVLPMNTQDWSLE